MVCTQTEKRPPEDVEINVIEVGCNIGFNCIGKGLKKFQAPLSEISICLLRVLEHPCGVLFIPSEGEENPSFDRDEIRLNLSGNCNDY